MSYNSYFLEHWPPHVGVDFIAGLTPVRGLRIWALTSQYKIKDDRENVIISFYLSAVIWGSGSILCVVKYMYFVHCALCKSSSLPLDLDHLSSWHLLGYTLVFPNSIQCNTVAIIFLPCNSQCKYTFLHTVTLLSCTVLLHSNLVFLHGILYRTVLITLACPSFIASFLCTTCTPLVLLPLSLILK